MSEQKAILFRILDVDSDVFRDHKFHVSARLGSRAEVYDFEGGKKLEENYTKFEYDDYLELKIYEDEKDERIGFFRLPVTKLWIHHNRSHVVSLKCNWIDNLNGEVLDEGLSADVRVAINFPNKPLRELEKYLVSKEPNDYDVHFERSTCPESRETFWREQA